MFRRNTLASPNLPSSPSGSTSTASLTTETPSTSVNEPTPVIPSTTPPSFPPVSKASSAMQAKSLPSTPTTHQEVSRRKSELSSLSGASEGKTLTVGRDIALSGSISSCERLIVEGSVEADLTDAIVLEVAIGGRFHGGVEVDEADIAGTIDGTLLVRKKLTLRSTGIIKGTIRYAKLSVELGGRIDGTIEPLATDPADMPLRSPLIPTYRSE